MSIGLLYWIIMLLWLLLGIFPSINWAGGWRAYSSDLMLFILLGLIGWKVFGPPVHG